MGKRYLAVSVTKELETTVYLCVDDSDPRVAAVLAQKGPFLPLTKELADAAERDAEAIDDHEWGGGGIEVHGAEEVSVEEATEFHVTTVAPNGRDG